MNGGRSLMNDLQIINKDGKLLTDSRCVAEMTGKRHADLMRDIKNYETILTNANLHSLNFFIESTYKDSKGDDKNMETNLVKIENGQPVTSSRKIAEDFKKRHADVIRAVEKHIDDLHSTQNCVQWFYETSYKDSIGRTVKEYLMNRDGFALLVMSFSNTRDVLQWKLKYIAAFNEMEQRLALAEFDLPRTLPDALRYLANEVEAHEETKLQLAVAKPKIIMLTRELPIVSAKPLKSASIFGESILLNQSISVNALNCVLTQIFYM